MWLVSSFSQKVSRHVGSILRGLPWLPGAPVFDEGAYDDLDEESIHYSNEELLETLKSDENEEELHSIALKDASLHRMTHPVEANSVELSKVACMLPGCSSPANACIQVLMVPRFGVAQGLKPDGSAKIRAVDHFSWSCTSGQKKRKRAEVKQVPLMPQCICTRLPCQLQASVNGHWTMPANLHHEHVDHLLVAMRRHMEAFSEARICILLRSPFSAWP